MQSSQREWQRIGDVLINQLPNGLDIVCIENPVVPLVTIEIDVRNGAYTETPEFDGLSHLYEHMFFKANEQIPDQEAYMRRARELGMEWNGTTSDERVNYFFTLHRKNLEPGLRFMNDAIRTPLFLQDEIVRERPVVLGEYDRAESDPNFHLAVAVHKSMWHKYYSRKNVLGSREIINTATTAKMKTIQERYYVPNNSCLLVAGDVERNEVLAWAESVFGDWQRAGDPFAAHPIPQHPPMTESRTFMIEKPVQSVTVLLGFHGPSVVRDPRATYAADVLSFILSQRSSRFYRNLVDSGLTVGASLNYQSLRYTGPIHGFLRTDAEHVEAAIEALWKEIASLAEDDVFSDEDLENAKNQIETDHVYEMERPSQHVHTVGYWWAIAGLDYYGEYIEHLHAVTRADVQAFVRDYVHEKPHVTGILAAPEMRPQLAGINAEQLS